MEKILKAKVVGASNGAWYKKHIGKHVEVKPFTHNYYLDAHDRHKTYNIRDLKVVGEVSG